jgi:ribosome-associated toxin RatA of RatAB toxin-antitoxin module
MASGDMIDRLAELEDPGQGAGPLVRVHIGEDKLPVGASGALRLAASPDTVWALIRDVERYPELVHMIHRAKRDGEEVWIQLRFRMAVISAKFGFHAALREEPGRSLDLSYTSGEPRDIRLRFELEPVDGGAATLLRVAVTYDIFSLGFLVKFFLRHHPEIQHGVYPGTVLSLLDSIRLALSKRS